MVKAFIIYRLTNHTTLKSYVGATTKTLAQRWQQHKNSAILSTRLGRKTTYLWRAIQKYGVDDWSQEVLFSSVGPASEMFAAERDAIQQCGTFYPQGYNLTLGGEGSSGHKMSDEARRRMSIMRTGSRLSAENRAKMSASRRGVSPSLEHRKHLADAQMGEKNHRYGKSWSVVDKERLRERFSGEANPFYGKSHTTESREKIRQALLSYDFRGGRNPAARAVCVDGVTYLTMRDAMRDLGVSYMTLRRRIESPTWPTYHFVERV